MNATGRLTAAFLALAYGFGPASAQTVTLRASHQWAGDAGDPRDEAMRFFAQEVEKARVGVDVTVYPGAALFKPREQWAALVKGRLDLAMFPLDYAAGRHPPLGAALMPGLARSYSRLPRLNASPFMAEIRKVAEQAGVVVIMDGWLSGAFVSRKACVTAPETAKAHVVRATGPAFEQVLAAAEATVSSIPAPDIHAGMQTGVLDGTLMSTLSIRSLRLHELAKCLTAPGENSLWFSYTPILMSKRAFDSLDERQRATLIDAGKRTGQFFDERTRMADAELVDAARKAGVTVVEMSAGDLGAWLALARQSAFKKFAEEVKGGEELIARALEVD